ncbi:MAG: chorismate synthase [Bacilli bacterium]|nr:chorismate synthase [Bacilli bacterium]
MSNVLGKYVTLTLFGESHGPYVGATLDGMPAGIEVKEDSIKKALSLRRPSFSGETPRVENDEFEIISGVFDGKTNGAPITIIIKNSNIVSKDYDEVKNKCRPNHADYVANQKYRGFEDYRGGGHFSGRITAALVAVGAVAQEYLLSKGIKTDVHIAQLGAIKDKTFDLVDPTAQMELLEGKAFPVIDEAKTESMKIEMEKAQANGDSVGGSIEVAITGLPVGLGEPWFNRFDGALANAMMSIGGVRGVTFGDIDENVGGLGSNFNDPFYVNEEGKIKTKTNHSGGVQGGITNAMPVVFKALIKPTPSISTKQETVTKDGENTTIALSGRHDPCIVRRMASVLKAVAALVSLDFYVGEFGRR